MPRLPEVPRDDVTDEKILYFYDHLFGPDKDPAVDHGTIHATPGDWWTVFAQSPAVFRHAVRGFALYRNATVDPLLRELGQGRAGYARGSRFVFSQHCKQMRSLGMPEEKIEAIAAWQVSDLFTPAERAVLAYTDALVYDGGRVPDGVFDAVRQHFSPDQLLQLTYIIGLYDMHATMCKALRLEFDDVPERVTEVEIPEGVEVADLSADLAGR